MTWDEVQMLKGGSRSKRRAYEEQFRSEAAIINAGA
jgi:hypothetical protein